MNEADQTPHKPILRWARLVLGLTAIGIDFIMAWRHMSYAHRGAAAALVFLVLIVLTPRRRESLALYARPRQGWVYWGRVVAVLLGGVTTLVLIVGAAAWVMGFDPPVYTTPTHRLWHHFVHMCLLAPLVEELIYRWILTPPVNDCLGKWPAIVASGSLFAALHWVYGNPSPENQIGGFILAWAMVHSGSILIPWLMHAFGNALALSLQWIASFWFPAAAG